MQKKVININWHTRPSPPTQPIENHLRYGCSRCVCVGSHYKSNQRLICVAAESWFLSSQYEKDLKFIFFGNFPLHPAPSTHWGNFLSLFCRLDLILSTPLRKSHRLYKWPICHLRHNLFCLKSDQKKKNRFEILDW